MSTAMAAMVLAVLPAQANAQEDASSAQDAPHASRIAEYANVVVRPGDSLWKISEERLGPNAAPQRIANEVERIVALNRNRIGADPNLLVVGQELLLPPVGLPPAAKPGTPDQVSTKPAEARSVGRGFGDETARTSGTTTGDVSDAAGQDPNPASRRGMILRAPTAPRTPKARIPSAGTDFPPQVALFERTARPLLLAEIPSAAWSISRDDPILRRLLGSGIIALTLLVVGTLAWKLPLKRSVGAEAELWKARHRYCEGTRRLGSAWPATSPAVASISRNLMGDAAEIGNGFDNSGMLLAARKRRERIVRERALGPRPNLHRHLVSGTRSPRVTRQVRRAGGLRGLTLSLARRGKHGRER